MNRNYFILDGVPSYIYETFVASSNFMDGPERDVESIEIPGKSGNLIKDNGRYKNFPLKVSVYISKDIVKNTHDLRNFLTRKMGAYFRYEEALIPNEFRMARLSKPLAIANSDRVGGSAILEFECKPQRYLKSGENTITYTQSGSITNPTEHEALPLLRVYGTGSVTLGNVMITISECNEYTDIDCDIQECFKGNLSCNDNVSISNIDFPSIPSGASSIVLGSGISKVEVIPRWWNV